MSSSIAAEGLAFDPYDYAFQADPYPTYAALRAHAPVHHEAEQDFYVLSRHGDIAAALRDEVTFSNAMGVSLDESAWSPQAHRTMSFLAMDPPRQTRLRKLVSRGFTPRRVKEMEPNILRLTRRHLDGALERAGDGEEIDWIADFAGLLPMDVISEMMGVPEADRSEVRRLADLVVHRVDGLRDVPPEGMDAALHLIGYFVGMVDERRSNPADDLTSALIAVETEDGDRLTEEEVIGFLFLMVVAGNETTTKLLGNSLFWATRHDLMDRILDVPDDHDLVSRWIEETLRFDTSSQILARHVTKEVTFHDRTIPAGSKALVLLGSANRDERVFTDPTRYHLDRDPADAANLLSFGVGRHFCLGANLARLEANVVLRELVARVAHIDVDHDRAERVHSVNVRGFAHLPARLEVR